MCQVSSAGIDFAAVLRHGREVGGPALRAMTFHERAAALKAMARHLMEKAMQAVLEERGDEFRSILRDVRREKHQRDRAA